MNEKTRVVDELQKLLDEAVKKSCDKSKVGLIFSAGIDSTLLGYLASKHSNVIGYAVGITGSHDLEYSRRVAGELPFDIKLIEVTIEDIEGALPDIVSLVGEANPLGVSVDVPFYFASLNARKDGLKVMLCGQGGDELFGGYNRYIVCLSDKGYEEVNKLMRYDLDHLWETNLGRDTRVVESQGITLRAPYLDREFVGYVSSIPVELRIREVSGEPEYECVDEIGGMRLVRKYIQRKLAEKVGLPDDVLNRSKKAAQYGSGSQKMLEKLARKNNFKGKARDAGRRDYVRMYLESLLKK